MMRQIIYVSISTAPGRQADIDSILHQSRNNNALNGVTGLLWVRGDRYLQVLEGSPEAVDFVMSRIVDDPRHSGICVLIERDIERPEFGSWSMALRQGSETVAELDARIGEMVARRSDEVKACFTDFLA